MPVKPNDADPPEVEFEAVADSAVELQIKALTSVVADQGKRLDAIENETVDPGQAAVDTELEQRIHRLEKAVGLTQTPPTLRETRMAAKRAAG